jgi:hypothetical protein
MGYELREYMYDFPKRPNSSLQKKGGWKGERKKEKLLHEGSSAMKWSLQVGAVCCKYG